MASDAKPAQDKASSDAKADETTQQQAAAVKKPALGEDDEFEDFPVDGRSPSLWWMDMHACWVWTGGLRRLLDHVRS